MQIKHLMAGLMLVLSNVAVAMPSWQTSSSTQWQMPKLNNGEAALVFVRDNKAMTDDSSTNIAINGRFITSLQDNHYTSEKVCAGLIQLSAMPTRALTNNLLAEATTVSLAPGQIQYVYVDVDANYRPTLHPLGKNQAMQIISNAKLQTHQISRHQTKCTLIASAGTIVIPESVTERPATMPTPVMEEYSVVSNQIAQQAPQQVQIQQSEVMTIQATAAIMSTCPKSTQKQWETL